MNSITILGPDPAHGGVGTYTRDLASSNDDFETIYFFPEKNVLSHIASCLNPVVTGTNHVHIQYTYELFRSKGAITFVILPLMWFFTRIRRKRLGVTMHEVWDDSDINRFGASTYAHLIHLWLWAFTDQLVFLSESALIAYNNLSVIGTGTVIPHGVPNKAIQNISSPKAMFGVKEESFLITQHGFVNERKGYDRFLNIARQLPNYQFLIAGGPRNEEHEPLFEDIITTAPENVKVTGCLDETKFHAAFQASDLAVLPYESIYQSGIFNWCARYELPVISSNILYFESLEREHGSPLTFTSDREASNLIQILSNNRAHRQSLSKSIQKYADNNSMDRVAEMYEELYRLE